MSYSQDFHLFNPQMLLRIPLPDETESYSSESDEGCLSNGEATIALPVSLLYPLWFL